jgi:vacuolar-type H+-ATPase subunit I/STV1
MTNTRSLSITILALGATMACGMSKEHAAADSARAATAAEQTRLATQLAAQKDSLTRVVLQADDFIMKIDSSVSRVKGLSKGKKKGATLDPLAQQIQNRKAVMERVNALVARAQATQVALSKANKDNAALRAQLASDSTMIADLNSTIQRQTAAIDALSTRVDSLNGVTKQLGATIAELEQQHNKAFYVIGTEDELLQRNVIVREGGANLLIAHPGRTLQMSRTVDPTVFTAVDQRGTKTIEVPDANRRYRVVSRQSLDYATVSQRDNDTFQGNLTIADIGKFWAPSRFLIIVQQ